ncbi:MAG: penicillin acylase family protein, partial [Betaproteobacteria bacterium]
NEIDAGGRWTAIAADRAPLLVRGRTKPIDFVRQTTPHGVIVASDRERHVVFALRWTGFEPGTAAMLGALALDRAQDWREFHRALVWWRAPAATFVYADRDGIIASQAAGLVPVRRGWDGRLPVPGWTGAYDWRGWQTLGTLPHQVNPRVGYVVDANGSLPRTARIREAIRPTGVFGARASAGLQHDVHAWTADTLVPQLARLHTDDSAVERARARLLAWNREMATASPDATLYALWEEALDELRAERDLAPQLAQQYIAGGLAPPLATDGGLEPLLLPALKSAVASLAALADPRWGTAHALTFAHPLGVTAAARRRFDVGPFALSGYADTVMATAGEGLSVVRGPSFRQVLDLSDWDRAVVSNAPGQSESPDSPHFADLARGWARGLAFPLAFSDTAIGANAGATLRLVPAAGKAAGRLPASLLHLAGAALEALPAGAMRPDRKRIGLSRIALEACADLESSVVQRPILVRNARCRVAGADLLQARLAPKVGQISGQAPVARPVQIHRPRDDAQVSNAAVVQTIGPGLRRRTQHPDPDRDGCRHRDGQERAGQLRPRQARHDDTSRSSRRRSDR